MTHEYKLGDRVEAFVAGQWSPATVTRADLSCAHPAHRIMWPSGNEQWISGECLRPLPAEPAPKPHDPEAIDPEELRLMREVCDLAEKVRDPQSPYPKTAGEFVDAIDALKAYRNPPAPRCEPPECDQIPGSYHWVEDVKYTHKMVPFCWTATRETPWATFSDALSCEQMAEKGYVYHSVAMPAPVWSDEELETLYLCWHGDSEGATAGNDAIDFAHALLSGDKSLIGGKS